ncbi:MAG: single-stranded DNA-binding protein [Candidatus Zixiibacteriota bacterium]
MAETKLPILNRVLIVGNLVKDPEMRYTSTGVPVANFKIASNKRFKDGLGVYREDVCYIGVVAWHKLAESCNEFLKKGSSVLIEGELRSRLKENGDGTRRSFVEIKALHVQFLDKKADAVPLDDEASFFAEGDRENSTELESFW